MKIIEPSYEILTDIDENLILKQIELSGRTCYKSEDKITDDATSATKLVSQLIKNGHGAMLEFADVTVKFIHSRGFSHEMVRHRMCSFAQESTRYCNYSNEKFGNELTFINPYWLTEKWIEEHSMDMPLQHSGKPIMIWQNTMERIEKEYFNLLDCGLQPQAARGILPNDLKTEIVVKANIREWRHIFGLRAATPAHPDMRRVMIPLLEEFQKRMPILFTDCLLNAK